MESPCASFYGVHWVLTTLLFRHIFGAVQTNPMNDFDTIDTDLWHEIQDCGGEIFDLIPELRDDTIKESSFDDYLKSNFDC